jgi:hypothetical protein
VGNRSIPLASLQSASVRVGDIIDENNIDLVTLTADVTISAALTTKLPGGIDVGITNATLAPGAPSTLYFPFVPTGPQGVWTTYVGVSNLASAAQVVSLTFTPDTGAPVTVQQNLGPNGTLGDTVANLFGTPTDRLTAGWVRVSGSGPLAGVAAYQDLSKGSLAIVPSQSTGNTSILFGHIASLSPWYTGIALLNIGTTAANVEVYALDSTGQLIGTPGSFSLSTGRRSSLLSEFVPQVLQRAADGGWVFVRTTNNVPVLGFELFGHTINPILANVQGFPLPPSSTFLPPGATATGGASIDHLSITDVSGKPKTQFSPKDGIVYVTTIALTGAAGSAQLTVTIKDPNNQVMVTSTNTVTLAGHSLDLSNVSFIPGNALNGQYTFTSTITYQGKTDTKSAPFTVAGGTTTASIGQEVTLPLSTSNVFTLGFRPGDTVRFSIPTANFTNSAATGTINYQLTGPGLFNGGTGTVTYSIPTGISFKNIDVAIPGSAPEGLFAFTSNLTVQGSPAPANVNGTAITVVPAKPSEAAAVDVLFVADTSGVPRGGFAPGSDLRLYTRRFSSFGVSIPVTIRYKVTATDGSVVTDQSLQIALPNGGSDGFIPLSLRSDAIPGTYSFDATISYQDSTNSTKSSTLHTTFAVGNNPPALTPSVTSGRLYVTDMNFVARTNLSQGENFYLVGSDFTTYTSPVAGTILYQLLGGSQVVLAASGNSTFTPGLSTLSFGPITGTASIAAGTIFTFTATATVPGSVSSNSTQFTITSPSAPPLPFSVSSADAKAASATRSDDKEDESR